MKSWAHQHKIRLEEAVVKPKSEANRRQSDANRKQIGGKSEVLLGKKGPAVEEKEGILRVETKNAKLVKLDCAGEVFITTESSLSNYPDTLLGDPQRRRKYYDESSGLHFFDRNQDMFGAIIYFYQSPGTFRAPEHIDPIVVEEELNFFGIHLQKMTDQYDAMELAKNAPPPPTKRQRINKMITDPSYNNFAIAWGAVDLFCIIVTISMLVMETIPDYKHYFENPFESPSKTAIYLMDVFVNIFFSVDIVIKFASCEDKRGFFCETLNVMDVLAVSPFYVELIVLGTTSGAPPPQFLALKVCRIVRVVRVLKIVRHSKQLTEVMEVVTSAKQEFGVLIGVVGVVILLVGTVMYFIEFKEAEEGEELDEKGFNSILHGCWWAIVTITTVGYGDLFPETVAGKLVGSMVVLFGIVVLAFPMTIIISKFQDSFTVKKLKANKDMTKKLREIAMCRLTRGVCAAELRSVCAAEEEPTDGSSWKAWNGNVPANLTIISEQQDVGEGPVSSPNGVLKRK